MAFANKVLDAVPAGALVLNQPQDGSVFAYGVNHLDTYYRFIRFGSLNDNAKAIAGGLSDYAANEAVKEAVKSTGTRYLLVLDKGVSYGEGTWLPQYHEEDVPKWSGIDGVDDDTPGFKVVLAEGDMRLYELTDLG